MHAVEPHAAPQLCISSFSGGSALMRAIRRLMFSTLGGPVNSFIGTLLWLDAELLSDGANARVAPLVLPHPGAPLAARWAMPVSLLVRENGPLVCAVVVLVKVAPE